MHMRVLTSLRCSFPSSASVGLYVGRCYLNLILSWNISFSSYIVIESFAGCNDQRGLLSVWSVVNPVPQTRNFTIFSVMFLELHDQRYLNLGTDSNSVTH